MESVRTWRSVIEWIAHLFHVQSNYLKYENTKKKKKKSDVGTYFLYLLSLCFLVIKINPICIHLFLVRKVSMCNPYYFK